MLTPTYIYATPAPRQVTTIYGRHIDLDPHYADPSYGLKWDQHNAAVKFTDAEHYVLNMIEKVKAVYKPLHQDIDNVIKNNTTYNYLKEESGWHNDGNGQWFRLSHYISDPNHPFQSRNIILAEYHIHTSRIIESIKYIDK